MVDDDIKGFVGTSHKIFSQPHLQGFDLVLEAIDVLLRDLLAGDLALDPLEPAVQIVEVLPGLAELLLHGLLKGTERGALHIALKRWKLTRHASN